MFFLSILFVILSSYLTVSALKKGDDRGGKTFFLYLLLTAFAQIVLSFEVLSLLNSISKTGFLICNAVYLTASAVIFIKCRIKCHCGPANAGAESRTLKEILNALKRDKALKFLSICFILFLIFQLITIFLFPVTFGDALAYYLPRCTSWIQNGSIAHFITPDTRELIMPVNMEFLYTWFLLFTKSEKGIAVFSLIGFFGAVYVIYNLLKELNFSVTRRLWAVFVFSSFSLVLIEMITPCADLFIGALILAAVYLFIKACRYDDKTALFFSALAYALAAGTKTTALIAAPSVLLIFALVSYTYKKNYILKFSLLFILNFAVFAGYNYILNFMQFSNPLSCPEQFLLNEFRGGFKGYITNLIKYCFAFLDMSGMPLDFSESFKVSALIEYWQTLVFQLFGTVKTAGASNYFPPSFVFSSKIGMMTSALGAMGLFAFLPSLIYAVKRTLKNRNSKTALLLGVLAASLLFNILLFSRVMVFTSFNMRYIFTFAVIAAPVLAYSYPVKKHKLCRIFLCAVMFIYLIGYTHHKPAAALITYLNVSKGRLIPFKLQIADEEARVFEYFASKPRADIALIASRAKAPLFYIEKLKLYGFKLDKVLVENIEDYNLEQYDYIISNTEKTAATNIVKFKEKMQYPDLSASKCLYNDKNQNTIAVYGAGMQPAMIECRIPFEYIKSKGFERDSAYNGKNYIILQKIHTNE